MKTLMNWKHQLLKWLITVAVITTPFWLGLPLLSLGEQIESIEMQSCGFGIAAIVPQYVQCPYSLHYKDGHVPHYGITSMDIKK